jgi:hypothetical protein
VSTAPHFVVHDKPAWRDRSTSVIRATVRNPPDGETWYEQLWARKIDDGRYELCCIPFATYDYALGDVVEVGPGGDSAYLIHGVVERSGRVVLRAWLADSTRETWDALQGMLRFRRLQFEFRKPALVAIDVADQEAAAEVEAELRELEKAGRLRYERGSDGYEGTTTG